MKRLLVFVLSCGFFVFDQIRRFCLRSIGKGIAGTCVVLQYHAIPGEQRARFAKQLDILRRYATPVRADSRDALDMSLNYVAVTFDDGLSSFVENALPELEMRKIPTVVFVVVGRLGTVPAWSRHSSDTAWTSVPSTPSEERMLTAEQLQMLDGRVLIGSHSLTHRMLAALSPSELEQEIEGSRRQLEAILGRKVTLFSFPYGAFAEHLLPYCAGYERIFTIEPILARLDARGFVSGRVSVDPTDWGVEFRLKISGYYRWLPHAVAAKRALFTTLRLRPGLLGLHSPGDKQTARLARLKESTEIGSPGKLPDQNELDVER